MSTNNYINELFSDVIGNLLNGLDLLHSSDFLDIFQSLHGFDFLNALSSGEWFYAGLTGGCIDIVNEA